MSRPPLEELSRAVRVKLVRGQRVHPALIDALNGLNPGWRGHDDLLSLVRMTTGIAPYRFRRDDTGGHQRGL